MANLPQIYENLDGILMRNVFVFQLMKGVIGPGADPCCCHVGAQSKKNNNNKKNNPNKNRSISSVRTLKAALHGSFLHLALLIKLHFHSSPHKIIYIKGPTAADRYRRFRDCVAMESLQSGSSCQLEFPANRRLE